MDGFGVTMSEMLDYLVNVTHADGSNQLIHWNSKEVERAKVAEEVVRKCYGANYLVQQNYPLRLTIFRISITSKREIFQVGIALNVEKREH